MTPFHKTIIETFQEPLDRRLVRITVLSCEHRFWQELDKPLKRKRFCTACWFEWLDKRFGYKKGLRIYMWTEGFLKEIFFL